MRRAVVVLGTTAAGLAALFSYKTHVAGVADASASSRPTGLSASAPPMTSSNGSSPVASPATTVKKSTQKASSPATAPAKSRPATAPPSKTPPTSSTPKASPSTAPSGRSGTFAGPSESTQYGNVQVTLTVADGKITNANGSLPGGGDSIGQNAIPQLNQEVLTAQSANIQAVSGATYTSDGYIESLQQAVDQAGL